MIPHANVAKQFLNAPPLAPGQSQLSEGTRKMQPDEEKIELLCTFTGPDLTRDKAIKYLEARGGNLEEAANDFFTDPNRYDNDRQAWDETAFGTDREGTHNGINQAGIPSFNIEGGMDQGIGGTSAAPTRPPSRRSNYSSRSGQQEGTINSMGQDTTGRTFFGPATKDAYEPAQWAMVVSSSSRVYENPDADERMRKRENGEPVFFKPLKERDALPVLVAVLGQIPKTRRELLCEQVQEENYGTNMRWWDGEDAHAGEPNMVDDKIPQQDLIEETQRLMAFVQESDRMYGSVEQLEKLPGMSAAIVNDVMGSSSTDTGEVRFLLGWSKAAEIFVGEESQKLFKSIVRSVDTDSPDGDEETNRDILLFRLDIDLANSHTKQNIYQAIDDLFTRNDRNGDANFASWAEQVATVLCIRVRNRDNNDNARGLGLDVPASFYADRWLKGNVETMKQMRRHRKQLRESQETIDEDKEHLNMLQHPSQPGKFLDREQLFAKTISYYEKRDKSDKTVPRLEPHEIPVVPSDEGEQTTPAASADGDVAMGDEKPLMNARSPTQNGVSGSNTPRPKPKDPPRTKWGLLALELERQHEKIKARLRDLDERRKQIDEQISNLGNTLTEKADGAETDCEGLKPDLLYRLRGVGIGPAYEAGFVYVDNAPSDPEGMEVAGQWWRFEYPSSGSWSKPHTRQVTSQEVLEETSDVATEALLIYAENSACDVMDPANATPHLWPSLSDFTTRDNSAFTAELQEMQQTREAERASLDASGWPTNTDGADDERPALPPRNSSMDPRPPAYEDEYSTQHIEHIPDLKVDAPEEDTWVPDPGPGVVSDAEYAANVNYAFAGQGRGVSTMMSEPIMGSQQGAGYGRIDGGSGMVERRGANVGGNQEDGSAPGYREKAYW